MLNPAFPRNWGGKDCLDYILPDDLAVGTLAENSNATCGAELRLQDVFGRELWKKIDSLGLAKLDWPAIRILDACCGSGFLAYHLLTKVVPLEITLIDASEKELGEAEQLINSKFPMVTAKFVRSDLLQNSFPPSSFDLIIGNSFLHHLYDLPQAVREFFRLLTPGGLFATMHEPTVAAVAAESGSFRLLWKYWSHGVGYIDELRPQSMDKITQSVDLWLFEPGRLSRIFSQAGFKDIRQQMWNLARSFLVARLGLHLTPQRPKLTRSEEALFNLAVRVDSVLKAVFPSPTFGSVSMCARKPMNGES